MLHSCLTHLHNFMSSVSSSSILALILCLAYISLISLLILQSSLLSFKIFKSPFHCTLSYFLPIYETNINIPVYSYHWGDFSTQLGISETIFNEMVSRCLLHPIPLTITDSSAFRGVFPPLGQEGILGSVVLRTGRWQVEGESLFRESLGCQSPDCGSRVHHMKVRRTLEWERLCETHLILAPLQYLYKGWKANFVYFVVCN